MWGVGGGSVSSVVSFFLPSSFFCRVCVLCHVADLVEVVVVMLLSGKKRPPLSSQCLTNSALYNFLVCVFVFFFFVCVIAFLFL